MIPFGFSHACTSTTSAALTTGSCGPSPVPPACSQSTCLSGAQSDSPKDSEGGGLDVLPPPPLLHLPPRVIPALNTCYSDNPVLNSWGQTWVLPGHLSLPQFLLFQCTCGRPPHPLSLKYINVIPTHYPTLILLYYTFN